MRIQSVAVREINRVQSSLEHLLPTKLSRKDRMSMPTLLSGGKAAERRKHVPPRRRVPFWNLAVGDTVRVLAGDDRYKHMLGRIKDVDRHRNVVWLADRALAVRRASRHRASLTLCCSASSPGSSTSAYRRPPRDQSITPTSSSCSATTTSNPNRRRIDRASSSRASRRSEGD